MRTEGRNSSVVPVTVVCAIILVAWYIAAIFMNTVVAEPKIEALGGGFANTIDVSGVLTVRLSPRRIRLWSKSGKRCSPLRRGR